MSRAAEHLRLALAFVGSLCLLAMTAAPALAAGPPAWPTYHLDNTRSGNDTVDQPFAAVTGPVASPALNANVFASPLYLNGTVYVATEADTLYALDGSGMSVLWSVQLGSAAPSSNLPCGDVNPVGITGTPVIDPAAGVLYAAGLVFDGTNYSDHLWEVSLTTHAVLNNVVIDPAGRNFDPKVQNQRGALGLANGRVYIPFGGRDGDCGAYHGYIVSVAASDLSGLRVDFESTAGFPNESRGGIWAPGGMSFDGAGNVYAATGNGLNLTNGFDFSETVVKVSPAGNLVDWWAPTNWASLDSGDTDIGSINPTILGSTGFLFQAGKDGIGRLIDTAAMGHVSSPAFQASLGFGGCFGSAAFDGARIYVPCSGGLVAVTYNAGSSPSFSAAWHVSGCFAESPIVAGSAVFFKDRCNNFKVIDAATGAGRLTFAPGGSQHFATPSAGGGHIYIALANNSVLAYSLSCAAVAGNGNSTYTLDGFGGVHPAGCAPGLSGAPSFGFDIGRGLAVNPAGDGGVELDGFGGLHPLGTGSASNGTYFGWDIARGLALSPSSAGQGWTLDGWGGIHPYGGAPPIQGSYAYWPGWDIARGIVALPGSPSNDPSGYVLDGYGGLHPFGAAPVITVGPYWAGFDIARGVALMPGTTVANPGGWVLDGFGGIHPFGIAPAVSSSYDYWPGWDIARGLTIWSAGTPGAASGWTLDGYGGLHAFGGAPALAATSYQPGRDTFRACTSGGFAGGWDSGSKKFA